jgi:hypothetical protein
LPPEDIVRRRKERDRSGAHAGHQGAVLVDRLEAETGLMWDEGVCRVLQARRFVHVPT